MRKILGVVGWFATMLTVAFFFTVNVILVNDNTGNIGKNIINLKIKDREVFNYELFEEGIRDWIDHNKSLSSFYGFVENMNGRCSKDSDGEHACRIPVLATVCFAEWAEVEIIKEKNKDSIIAIKFRKRTDGC